MTNHSGGGTPRMGDYVLATKYDDGDPRDHFVIGFYDREENGRHYIKDSNGNQMRGNGFRRVERVTSEVGVWILENARTWEELGSVKSVWDYKALHELSAAQSALAEKERELDQLKRQIQSEIELSRELGEQVVAAEARAGEGWIPVSERLPDVDGIRWMIWVIDNYRMPYLASEYYHFHEGWATDEEVTHWMSLPAPPASPTGRKE